MRLRIYLVLFDLLDRVHKLLVNEFGRGLLYQFVVSVRKTPDINNLVSFGHRYVRWERLLVMIYIADSNSSVVDSESCSFVISYFWIVVRRMAPSSLAKRAVLSVSLTKIQSRSKFLLNFGVSAFQTRALSIQLFLQR